VGQKGSLQRNTQGRAASIGKPSGSRWKTPLSFRVLWFIGRKRETNVVRGKTVEGGIRKKNDSVGMEGRSFQIKKKKDSRTCEDAKGANECWVSGLFQGKELASVREGRVHRKCIPLGLKKKKGGNPSKGEGSSLKTVFKTT